MTPEDIEKQIELSFNKQNELVQIEASLRLSWYIIVSKRDIEEFPGFKDDLARKAAKNLMARLYQDQTDKLYSAIQTFLSLAHSPDTLKLHEAGANILKIARQLQPQQS